MTPIVAGQAVPAPPGRDDRMASAPAMRVTDRVPAAISEAARLTSHWGEFPPTVVTSTAAGVAEAQAAGELGGRGRARSGS